MDRLNQLCAEYQTLKKLHKAGLIDDDTYAASLSEIISKVMTETDIGEL